MVKGLEASDSWSSISDPDSRPTRGQLLAPNGWTELRVRVASTTHHPRTIFPTYPLGSGHQPQAIFPRHNSEGRHWVQVLVNTSALIWAQSPTQGTNCFILTTNSSKSAFSWTSTSIWSIRGLKSKPAHLNTAEEHKDREHYGYSHHLHCAQPTERADLPSQYRQVLVNRSFRKIACLYTSLSSFTVIYI